MRRIQYDHVNNNIIIQYGHVNNNIIVINMRRIQYEPVNNNIYGAASNTDISTISILIVRST